MPDPKEPLAGFGEDRLVLQFRGLRFVAFGLGKVFAARDADVSLAGETRLLRNIARDRPLGFPAGNVLPKRFRFERDKIRIACQGRACAGGGLVVEIAEQDNLVDSII